jgi:hypothetical protein
MGGRIRRKSLVDAAPRVTAKKSTLPSPLLSTKATQTEWNLALMLETACEDFVHHTARANPDTLRLGFDLAPGVAARASAWAQWNVRSRHSMRDIHADEIETTETHC